MVDSTSGATGPRLTAGRRVAVLLATRNGEKYLDEQLASLEAQDLDSIDVIASDDCSTDRTEDILAQWGGRWRKGIFAVSPGPCRGFAENFRKLLQSPIEAADYVAFCDQDDIWDKDKLSAGIDAIELIGGPTLYCSRTRLVDAEGHTLGHSPLFRRRPHFRNAIVQSIAGGNTMIMNRDAHALVAGSARRAPFVSHDWWCYIIVSGAGGQVHYDPIPHIAYRQHQANLVGDNAGLGAGWTRLRLLMQGRFSRWNSINLEALDGCAQLLTEEAGEAVARFKAIRAARWLSALALLWQSRIHRQTLAGNLMVAAAAALGKV